jgi:hypothetical protein
LDITLRESLINHWTVIGHHWTGFPFSLYESTVCRMSNGFSLAVLQPGGLVNLPEKAIDHIEHTIYFMLLNQ